MATRTIIGSAYWATYLINGDASGMTDIEQAAADTWCDVELDHGEHIVDCGDPYFTWSYALHCHDGTQGGDVVEYTVYKHDGV